MALSKKDRQKVFDKCNGRCAYCGEPLQKGWCADHIISIRRKQKCIKEHYKHKVTGAKIDWRELNKIGDINIQQQYIRVDEKYVPDGCDFPELDIPDNMLPACFSCNSYKSTMPVEQFRKEIGLLVSRLNERFSQYKIAKRFGQIEETNKPIVFYFETLQNQSPEQQVFENIHRFSKALSDIDKDDLEDIFTRAGIKKQGTLEI